MSRAIVVTYLIAVSDALPVVTLFVYSLFHHPHSQTMRVEKAPPPHQAEPPHTAISHCIEYPTEVIRWVYSTPYHKHPSWHMVLSREQVCAILHKSISCR